MHKTLIIAAAALLATSANAAPNLVKNGSFEAGAALAGTSYLAANDITSVTGWKVMTAGVNYVDSSVWNASSGSRSVELTTSNGNGGIWQRVDGFNIGKRYLLSFDLSADPFDPAIRPKDVGVFAKVSGAGMLTPFYTLQDDNSPTNMKYKTIGYEFYASANMLNVLIRGRAATGSVYGPVIDNVSISYVPEASVWAMLIAGFGLVGLASRRRNRAAVAA